MSTPSEVNERGHPLASQTVMDSAHVVEEIVGFVSIEFPLQEPEVTAVAMNGPEALGPLLVKAERLG